MAQSRSSRDTLQSPIKSIFQAQGFAESTTSVHGNRCTHHTQTCW